MQGLSMAANFVLEVLTSAAVSATLTGLLLWLTKSWIGERLKNAIKSEYDQKLETHKAELKSASDVEVERLRSQLNIAANEHNVLFSKLHDKRAEVIAETYSLLRTLYEAVSEYVKPFVPAGDRPKEEKYKDIVDSFKSFRSYYPKKQIFIPKLTAEKINSIDLELVRAINMFVFTVEQNKSNDNSKNWIAILEKLDGQTKVALAELEIELRALLGDKS
jgi:hypothetical protein